MRLGAGGRWGALVLLDVLDAALHVAVALAELALEQLTDQRGAVARHVVGEGEVGGGLDDALEDLGLRALVVEGWHAAVALVQQAAQSPPERQAACR